MQRQYLWGFMPENHELIIFISKIFCDLISMNLASLQIDLSKEGPVVLAGPSV